ncbi:uncharacterized protein LOC141664671 [Apium graveolens]|uniref:uncharacterized protein LOC141664671 n=1 Tax=Apium graveolens TaxID=4045 RepID=UPI003D78D918
MSLEEWTAEMLQHNRRNLINKVFMVAWAIWNNRIDTVWQQKGKEYVEIISSALHVLNNWESAQDKSFDISVGFITQEDGDVHWKSPQLGIVKVNTDATLFDESNHYNYVMVARYHEGAMMESISSCRSGSLNPEITEAIGIREALSWVKSKNWLGAVVETDCLNMVQAIRCSSVNLSYLGRVVDECKQLLVDIKSRNVTLKFVKRSANMIGHYLAIYSISIADRKWG